MPPHLPPALRTELSQRWSREAPAYLLDDSTLPVDAIWVPPAVSETQEPAAFLHCTAIQAESLQIQVLALPIGATTLTSMTLSPNEVAWLNHCSLPPTSEARVLSQDPLFLLPGEGEAFRIRCLALSPVTTFLPPSLLVAKIPGLQLRVMGNANPGRSTCEFHWTPDGTHLCVERDPLTRSFSEGSVGLALAAWYCSRTPMGFFSVNWADPIYQSSPLTSLVIRTYQALRLPAVHLFMLLRSAGTDAAVREVELARELNLPVRLIRDCIAMLRSQGEL